MNGLKARGSLDVTIQGPDVLRWRPKTFERRGVKLPDHGANLSDSSPVKAFFPCSWRAARGRRGGKSSACAFAGHAWPELRAECDQFKWVGIARLGSWIQTLRDAGCTQAIMVGRVAKTEMYDRWRFLRYVPDLATLRLFYTILRSDKRPQSILQALVDRLAAGGITLIDSTTYTTDHLVPAGVLTRRQPTDAQWIDIRHGLGHLPGGDAI